MLISNQCFRVTDWDSWGQDTDRGQWTDSESPAESSSVQVSKFGEWRSSGLNVPAETFRQEWFSVRVPSTCSVDRHLVSVHFYFIGLQQRKTWFGSRKKAVESLVKKLRLFKKCEWNSNCSWISKKQSCLLDSNSFGHVSCDPSVRDGKKSVKSQLHLFQRWPVGGATMPFQISAKWF